LTCPPRPAALSVNVSFVDTAEGLLDDLVWALLVDAGWRARAEVDHGLQRITDPAMSMRDTTTISARGACDAQARMAGVGLVAAFSRSRRPAA
jgi:hypothetical protein